LSFTSMCIVRGALRRLTEIVKGFNLVLEVSQKKKVLEGQLR
jgi:hypothetical protein